MEDALLYLGRARVCISPATATRLQGSINRTEETSKVMDDLFAKVLLFTQAGQSYLVVTADLFQFNTLYAAELREELKRRFGISPENTVLCASHTHTGPPTVPLGTLMPNAEYLAELTANICSAVEAARSEMEPVHVAIAGGSVPDLGVNRRKATPNGIRMIPNVDGPFDDSLNIVSFTNTSGSPRAVLVNTSFHPTTLGVHVCEISADYPGRMQRKLESLLGSDVQVHFTLGAAGDVKAAALGEDGNFREGDETDIERIGSELANRAAALLESATELEVPWIAVRRKSVQLPYAKLPSRVELQTLVREYQDELTSLEQQHSGGGDAGDWEDHHMTPALMLRDKLSWATHMIESLDTKQIPEAASAELQLLAFGTGLALYAIPGEPFTNIGLDLKHTSRFSHTVVCGYSNGTVGYIPSAEAVSEGGYEVEDAYMFYRHPSCFHADSQRIIVEAFEELAGSL